MRSADSKPTAGDWPTYNGALSGNRHSALTQIDTRNVSRLKLAWIYTLPYIGLQTTPLVSDGVMYVSGPNRVCALDARSGREIWCYSRTRGTADVIPGDAAKGANRGVALLGDRVFFATDNAHLICLNRLTGGLMWDVDVTVPGAPGRYGSTGAPLVVGDLVVTGVPVATLPSRDSSPPTRRPPASLPGASGRCQNAANRVRRHGRARRSIPEARPPG